MVLPLSQVYISMINAFKTDCQNLIKQFKEKQSADFRDFVPVWKEFKFSLIYEKYSKYGSIYDFKEDSLQIVKSMMLNDHFVGGLYLLYGLYFLQSDPKPGIRLELCEFEKIVSCVREERTNIIETCMPGYILSKLLKNNAFLFIRFAREFSMETHNRTRLIHGSYTPGMLVRKKLQPKAWLEEFMNETELTNVLKNVEKDYFELKKKLKEEYPEINLALDVAHDDTFKCIENDLMQNNSYPSFSGKTYTSLGGKRRDLKNRKMKIKHRYAKKGESQLVAVENPSNQEKQTKKLGCPRGERKHYLNKLINYPSESEENDNEESDPDEPVEPLPEL